tara:strand:- start:11251 stop:11442 length:192 start_codon:yes stop_codon:yes gene_type:complete
MTKHKITILSNGNDYDELYINGKYVTAASLHSDGEAGMVLMEQITKAFASECGIEYEYIENPK